MWYDKLPFRLHLVTTLFVVALFTTVAAPSLRAQGVSAAEFQALRAELATAIQSQNQFLQQDQKSRAETIQRMIGDLEGYSQAIRQLQTDLKTATTEVDRLKKENEAMKTDLLRRMSILEKAQNDETAARAAADQKIIADVSAEIARTVDKVNAALRDQAARTNQIVKEVNRAPVPAPTPVGPPAGNYAVYTVANGDTLSVISRAANVSVERIKAANNLKSDSIYVGQKLNIPKD